MWRNALHQNSSQRARVPHSRGGGRYSSLSLSSSLSLVTSEGSNLLHLLLLWHSRFALCWLSAYCCVRITYTLYSVDPAGYCPLTPAPCCSQRSWHAAATSGSFFKRCWRARSTAATPKFRLQVCALHSITRKYFLQRTHIQQRTSRQLPTSRGQVVAGAVDDNAGL